MSRLQLPSIPCPPQPWRRRKYASSNEPVAPWWPYARTVNRKSHIENVLDWVRKKLNTRIQSDSVGFSRINPRSGCQSGPDLGRAPPTKSPHPPPNCRRLLAPCPPKPRASQITPVLTIFLKSGWKRVELGKLWHLSVPFNGRRLCREKGTSRSSLSCNQPIRSTHRPLVPFVIWRPYASTSPSTCRIISFISFTPADPCSLSAEALILHLLVFVNK